MPDKIHQVVVIGAGPYGLAASNRLRREGFDVKVFGESMVFWERNMPKGMFLRSSRDASNIGELHGPLTIDAYEKAKGITVTKPTPLTDFIDYGRWFQQTAIPDLDTRHVMQVSQNAHGFDITLQDGEMIQATRVMVATGLDRFARRPQVFANVSPMLVSHASEHDDLGIFDGKSVVVVGGGQSALESAAILHESGAKVEVLARTPEIRWLSRSAKLHALPQKAQHLLYAPTDVGPPGLSWIVAKPEIFRRMPKPWHEPIAYRSIRPAGAGWLVPRLEKVPLTTDQVVVNATEQGGRVALKLADGGEREADHVLLATGYAINVDCYEFLDRDIHSRLAHQNGYPKLTNGFESTVPGLHFLGAASAISFSPVMRFVSGTWYTTDALAKFMKQRVKVVR
ncbi:MAG: NAD(P)-binding domain-containing protein [Nitrolancea sp.]